MNIATLLLACTPTALLAWLYELVGLSKNERTRNSGRIPWISLPCLRVNINHQPHGAQRAGAFVCSVEATGTPFGQSGSGLLLALSA